MYGPFQLRKWADVFVIAPLDANTMAKMSLGLCDNLLVRKRKKIKQNAEVKIKQKEEKGRELEKIKQKRRKIVQGESYVSDFLK